MLERPKTDKIGYTVLEAADLIERDGWFSLREPTGNRKHNCILTALNRRVPESDLELFNDAVDALRNYLNSTISEWNDAPGRTKEQVVTMLREFAYNRKVNQ